MKLTNFEGNVQYDLVEKNQLDQIIDDTAADSTNTTYSAQNIENKLVNKVNSSDVYTKTEVDTKLNVKANTSQLGTQVTYSLSGTTLTITTK